MPRRDAANSGYHPSATAPDGVSERWMRSSIDTDHLCLPAVTEETIYLAFGLDRNGPRALSALSVTDGSEQWPSPFEPNDESLHYATPAVGRDAVFVTANDLYAVDATDGTRQWRVETAGQTTSDPTVVGETVFVTGGNTAYAFDAKDGALRWSKSFPAQLASMAPVVADGRLFVHADETTYALDSADGSEQWNLTYGRFGASLTVVDDTLLTVSRHPDEPGLDGLWAFDAADGSIRWKAEMDPADTNWVTPLSAGNGRVCFGLGGMMEPPETDWPFGLYAYDVRMGNQLWVNETVTGNADHLVGTPVMVGDRIVAGGVVGQLWCVEAESGEIRWRDEFDGRSRMYPVVTEGGLYVTAVPNVSEATDMGEFYALDTDASGETV